MRKPFAYAKTKAQISCAVTEQLISALLYSPVCFWFGLMLNVPVNNFSVMLGRSHRFLGITSTIWGGGKFVLLKDTTRRPEWGSIKSSFERSIDKQNITLMVISYKFYQTRQKLV